LDFFVNADPDYETQTDVILDKLRNDGFVWDAATDFVKTIGFRTLKVRRGNSGAALKIDFVNDSAPHFGDFTKTDFFDRIDSVRNILSNKLGAVFRLAGKDVADIREIALHESIDWAQIISEARHELNLKNCSPRLAITLPSMILFSPMTLFLIAGMPVFFIAVLNVFFSDSFYGRELVLPLGLGVLWFFPCCFIYVLVSDLVPAGYEGKTLYFSRMGIDIGFPYLVCLVSGLITCRGKRSGGKAFFLHLAAFCTGLFMFFAQYVRIIFPEWYAEYIYFLLPLLWMSLTVFAGLLASLFFAAFGAARLLFPLILAALPFAMGAVPVLYIMNYRIFAWLLSAAFFAAPLILLWRLPLRDS
jgi:hypothetical protein